MSLFFSSTYLSSSLLSPLPLTSPPPLPSPVMTDAGGNP